MKAKIFLTGFAIIAALTLASAQNPSAKKGNGNCIGTGQGTAFIDANNNGICDSYENRIADATVVKRNGQRNGNENDSENCNGTGQGKRQGNGLGQGKGKNFVDNNQNGTCDKYEARSKK